MTTFTNDAYINSDKLVELLTNINRLHPDTAITLVMDNARYQRCDKVMNKAKDKASTYFFCPLFLFAEFKLDRTLVVVTKKQCLYNHYYESFCQFKAAIDDCLDKVKSTFSEPVKTLLNPKFQLFEKPQT